jgi:plastocyanin
MKRWAIVFAFLVGSVGLAACGGDDDDSSSDTTTDQGSGDGGAVDYVIQSIEYSDFTAPAGAEIDISNQSGAPHTFTADDGAFDTDVESDNTATVTAPSDPGDYAFHCNIHASMKATLTVD